MKKPYQKPRILFEHLELDSTISSCEYTLTTDGCEDPTPGDGYWDAAITMPNPEGSGTIIQFSLNNEVCKANSTFECYNVPASNYPLSSLS